MTIALTMGKNRVHFAAIGGHFATRKWASKTAPSIQLRRGKRFCKLKTDKNNTA
jgi:hypothetical protein